MELLNAKELDSIRNQSISSAIARQLEQLILSGEIAPGDRINESKLASQLGVSRAPIREACRQLEKYGMVEVRVGRGTFVRSVDMIEALELYDIRTSLEILAFEQAALNRDERDIKKLEIYISKMEENVENQDLQSYVKENLDFHHEIFVISRNKSLLSLLETITKKLTLFRLDILSQPGEMEKSLSEHKEIIEFIKSGNVISGSEAIKKHVTKGKNRIIEENKNINSEGKN